MRLNIAVPEGEVTKPVLDAALESVTRLNEQLISKSGVPQFSDAVDSVRWKPEPPGAEHFDHAAQVLKRGWGDCDDLAPWHAASLRVSGEDPGALAVVKRSGPKRWHAIVQRSDGTFDDPSLAAGMPGPRGARAAVLPVMSESSSVVGGELLAMPQIAIRPVMSDGEIIGWDARADIPWNHSPNDFRMGPKMVSLRSHDVADQAVVGALRGGIRISALSGLVSGEALNRANAISDYLEGAEWEDLAGIYGEDHADAVEESIGSFWDTIANVASKAVQFVPGIGPIASSAIDLAHKGVSEIMKSGASAKLKKQALALKARKAAKAKARTKQIVSPNLFPGRSETIRTASGALYTFSH